MLFSQTLGSMQPMSGGWTAVIGEDWSQGRATFGGMVSALGNEAMRRLVPGDRKLRSLQTTFVGPAPAGNVRLEAKILRTGKVATIAESRLWSADQIAATFTGIYGADRVSSASFVPATAPKTASVIELPESVRPPGLAPSFLQHFDVRWAEGSRPFTGTTSNRVKAYIRHKDSAPLTESAVVALIDCIPSVVLQMMTTMAPSSSMDWTLRFLRHDYSHAPDAWWRIDSEVKAASDGYSSESGVVYDPNGLPAALTGQLVAVFG
jgi:acyl-CoA thioesterase